MDLRATKGVASRFEAYIEHLRNAVGHADRREPLAAYCAGLLLPGERKSIEPMAARLAPEDVSAKHQSVHHFVDKAPWEEAALQHRAGVSVWMGSRVYRSAVVRQRSFFSRQPRFFEAALRDEFQCHVRSLGEILDLG